MPADDLNTRTFVNSNYKYRSVFLELLAIWSFGFFSQWKANMYQKLVFFVCLCLMLLSKTNLLVAAQLLSGLNFEF